MKDIFSEVEVEQRAYDVAVASAIKAGRHALKYWPNPQNPHFDSRLSMQIFDKTQGVGNYATIADVESEAIIIEAIQSDILLSTHKILAEESDEVITDSEYQWIIDPIDGTSAFKNGLPEFGVSIGLLKGKEPIIGVIAVPALEQVIAAKKGYGAKLISFENLLIQDFAVSSNLNAQPMDTILVAYDLGYVDRAVQLKDLISKIADKVGYVVCYGSCAASNFRLAQGLIGSYIFSAPTKFDIAGAAVIIPEIGGLVTDFKGRPIDWASDSRSFIASRSIDIHTKLLDILNN